MDDMDLNQSRKFLEYILMSNNPVESINENIDYLLEIIPEINYMIGFEHNHPHHHLDVWNHTLLAISKSSQNLIVRISLLLHDIGKPFSYQDGDIRHFKNHPSVSASIAKDILIRLEYNKEQIEEICELIKMHDIPINDTLLSNNKQFCLKLYEIQKCDALAHHPDKLEKRLEYIKKLENKLNI